MITPRTTRLVRAANLQAFRRALTALATDGPPLDARDRLVVVPTRAAAGHLVRSIEDRPVGDGVVVLPDFVTRAELTQRLFERLPPTAAPYSRAEREALLTVACRTAVESGFDPPFHVRPGLVAAMLGFLDALRRHQRSVDDFERLTVSRLEAGAAPDRGADRLLRQTRFFAAAFRHFERRSLDAGGVDEHAMRDAVLAMPAVRPIRHIVVAVRDRAGDSYGLHAADWDLLARVPGLDRLDVVVTDTTLAGAWHERIHQSLPGIEESRFDVPDPAPTPTLVLSPTGAFLHVARDREEEVAGFASWVRAAVRAGEAPSLDRVALVVHQRLPYTYLTRTVLASAGIPSQMLDALPLAAEPYAAALDVLMSSVGANFARIPAIALLRSPHFVFPGQGRAPLRPGDIAALDRELSEASYLGDVDALDRLRESWDADGSRAPQGARLAGRALGEVTRELAPLRSPASVASHLDRLLAFLAVHDRPPASEPSLLGRQLRARAAVHGLLRGLRDAYARFGGEAVEFDEVASMIRRGIEAHTFAPRSGDSGIHVVDAESARFGEFDRVQLAGLVDGEWPDRPRRNIFYSPAILRDLGWPADADRVDDARAAFTDLLGLPSRHLLASTFSLEQDSIVGPSTLADVIVSAFGTGEGDESGSRTLRRPADDTRIFEHEALGLAPIRAAALPDPIRQWAERRDRFYVDPVRRGRTAALPAKAYGVSAYERYQDCPFKFFAADVLKLGELLEDEPSISPRARGRFVHEAFQRFFDEWNRRVGGTITSARVDEARAVFVEVVQPLLERLPAADAALERARLFGSAIAVGMVDVVLGIEASRSADVTERWIEHRLDGEYSLGVPGGRRVALKGVADRVDLLAQQRLRVIDYKSGSAPTAKRALQVQIYALCAQESLEAERGGQWTVDEASYVAFAGKRSLVQVVRPGRADGQAVLADARDRLLDIVDGIERGEFPVRPYEPRLCSYCPYPSVCRKDYVGDE